MRAVRHVPVLALFFLSLLAPALGADGRQVVTTPNSDYFGFDLRSEQNVTLDQCTATCLADPSCRAFTYNTKAKWCFLKSDFALLKPFSVGAVLTTAELVEHSGKTFPEAEQEMARLLGAYGGEALVSPDGELVYAFPEIMATVQ